MLRASAKQMVFDALDDSYFGASNFSVTYGAGHPIWVRIEFIPNSSFRFEIISSSSYLAGPYQTREAPGVKLLRADLFASDTFEECVLRLPGWITRVKEEVIDANPISRELQSVRAELEQMVSGLAERQEEYFTKNEANELAARLNAFTSQLEHLANEKDELKATVDQLRQQLDELGQATQSVNKGTWFRMASSRLLKTTKALLGSKEARELALEAAKKILLEGPK